MTVARESEVTPPSRSIMTSGTDPNSEITSLLQELNNARSSTDIAVSRRDCTRLLNQLKGVLRQLSREGYLALISNSVEDDRLTDGSILSTLFTFVVNQDDCSTEGHRETSAEMLKGIIRGAFGCDGDLILSDGEDNETNSFSGSGQQNHEHANILTVLFKQYSSTFHKRMERTRQSNSDFHSNKGTITEPMESCEHIRLLLVEIMLDISTYLIESSGGNNDDKTVLEAASVTCYTLAKYSLSDPFPEVQRVSCSLIETLSRLCPLAVRMSASALLLPLAGNPESFSAVKSSLFRHRHTKSRCKAVDASVSILLCCSGESDKWEEYADDSACIASHQQFDSIQQIQLSKHGSKSTYIQQLLHESVLPGWLELVKLDPSASVRLAALKALGKVANVLDWSFSPITNTSGTLPTTVDLESVVETEVLTLFMLGISDGNSQVRTLAVQQLTSFCESKFYSMWDVMARYYQPLLQLSLERCSSHGAVTCHSNARSIEALQRLLTFIVPLSTLTATSDNGRACEIPLSESLIFSLVAVLTDTILSDEKDVLEASLQTCRVLGGIDELAIVVISHVSKKYTDQADKELDQSTAESFRRLASILLLMNGLFKGCLGNKELTAILDEIDSTIKVPAPAWLRYQESETVLCGVLATDLVLKSVTSHSSLAWALLDSMTSLVQWIKHPRIDGTSSEPTENTVVGILTCITYILGCPDEFGITTQAAAVLDELNSIENLRDSGRTEAQTTSLLDDYFRHVAMKVNNSSPFPWARSDPAFLAIDSLLRNVKGSTVRDNFDLVAPLFLFHLPERKHDENVSHPKESVKSLTAKENPNEEHYSFRICLMSLLQTILSDRSFSDGISTPASSSAQFSTQFTFDILLSLILPNLVWKSGGLAAALRKLSAATLFVLLSNGGNHSGGLELETYSYLLPVLHSNLDDTESTTRELSCACLSLIFGQLSPETFQDLWKNDARVIDTLQHRLMALLDDSHNPVRLAACVLIEKFLTIALTSQHESGNSCILGHSALEHIIERLVLALDDPEPEIQNPVFQALSVFLDLVGHKYHDKKIVAVVERHAMNGQKSHRVGQYCNLLLQLCSRRL